MAGKARSQSVGTLLQAPAEASSQKRPAWLRRNALIAPLNGPATSVGERPLVGLNPLQDFKRLHDYYGEEVKKAREEWQKSGGKEQQRGEGGRTDLGGSQEPTNKEVRRFAETKRNYT